MSIEWVSVIDKDEKRLLDTISSAIEKGYYPHWSNEDARICVSLVSRGLISSGANGNYFITEAGDAARLANIQPASSNTLQFQSPGQVIFDKIAALEAMVEQLTQRVKALEDK